MTLEQFVCCTGNRAGASTDAARLVLVDGLSQDAAALQTGISIQGVRNALVRIRKRDAQIRAAYLAGSA